MQFIEEESCGSSGKFDTKVIGILGRLIDTPNLLFLTAAITTFRPLISLVKGQLNVRNINLTVIIPTIMKRIEQLNGQLSANMPEKVVLQGTYVRLEPLNT